MTELEISIDPQNPEKSLKTLLQSTTTLRRLSLDVSKRRDLSFLATTDLTSAESLRLRGIQNGTCLRPITATPRPRLQALTLAGDEVQLDLAPVVSGGAAALPALESLTFEGLFLMGSTFMSKISLKTLEKLAFKGCAMDNSDIASVAAALPRLPLLEVLEVEPYFEDDYEDSVEWAGVMKTLLRAPLPHLCRLRTWFDDDKSLKVLIDSAQKVPKLEEISMGFGHVSSKGFAALAAAGRRGVWPQLRSFEIHRLMGGEGKSKQHYCGMLQEVWPGLTVKIGENTYLPVAAGGAAGAGD